MPSKKIDLSDKILRSKSICLKFLKEQTKKQFPGQISSGRYLSLKFYIIKIMSTIIPSSNATQRKNKQKLKKFVSMINDYEDSLNKKVDDMINHMITYAKKCQDPLVLPEIKQPRSASERSKSFSRTINNTSKKYNSRINYRDKSMSSGFSFLSEITQNMEEKINNLKKSVADSMIQQNSTILPQGRPLGTKRYVKPKYLKRQADVVPREVRLDPFTEKNIIKAQDLDKGILNLIEKGVVGKDVDIITAFEKGGEVLSSKQAIFHHGEERITKNQPISKPKKRQEQDIDNFSKMITVTKKPKLQYEENNWAITMPESQMNMRENIRKQIQIPEPPIQTLIQQTLHLKFLHYSPVLNDQFKRFMLQHCSISGEINMVINEVGLLLQKNCIEVAYVSSSKLLDLSSLPRKLSTREILSSILSFKDKSTIPLREIFNIQEKKNQAAYRIQALFKRIRNRRFFNIYLSKKKVQNKIVGWLYNMHIRKQFKQSLQVYRKQVIEKFESLQSSFRQQYFSITSQKHYQIHISNKSLYGKESYKQLLNTQITRIFNFDNPNTYIIIILSEPLSQETKNYYYKIMELEEIPNFHERVTFLNVGRYGLFADKKLTCSERLYYDSKLVREIKRRIGSNSAYFRISYPTFTDVSMATYLGIPILTGDLIKLFEVQKRSQSINYFGLPELTCFRVKPSQLKPLSLSSALMQFCDKHKRYRNYVMKINGTYQSKGIGLLTYPFTSLPQMYSNTAFIISNEKSSVSEFYRSLCKNGGIIQAFEQNLSSVVVIGKIDAEGHCEMTATYDKISYGFVNVGYFFPQMAVSHSQIVPVFNTVAERLADLGHFGDFQLSLYVDEQSHIYFDKVQCYQTEIGSSLFYFKFLCHGNMNNKGQFITKIIQTFETDDNKEEELTTLEPRSYCYIPYILHFGLSDKQIGSFFQLCRMGGISFDLENKYGSTFILLGSLKNSMGMITTAKDRDTCRKLMVKSLDFIIKQNAHNSSKEFMQEKQLRMRERENIFSLKERLEDV